MAYVVNQAITDTFIIRDNANAAITGLTSGSFATLEAYAVAAPGTTAAITITEIGSGEYRISFTPTTPTSGEDMEWFFHAVYSSGGVFREPYETYSVTAAVSTTTVVVAASASGSQTSTLAQLRREVADRFEDVVAFTATANGNVGKTTLIDTYHVNNGTEHFNGRDIICTSGTNSGLKRRVTDTAKSTGTLTLNSALTVATATNDTFEVYNRAERGFTVEQYDRVINYAIRDAYPTGLINVVASVVLPFDATVPEITVPATLTEVNSLEAQGSDGDWFVVPAARSAGGDGWYADPASGQLRLYGCRAWGVDTLSLRVFGMGLQPTLSADSDVCALSPKFIVAAASYKLALGGVAKPSNDLRVNLFRDEMERYRTTLRRFPGPIRKKIRAS